MIRNEEETRQTCTSIIDKLIDDQKMKISHLEIMKEHINDMSSEQFDEFGLVFAYSMGPDMVKAGLSDAAVICAVNDAIEHIKKKEVE